MTKTDYPIYSRISHKIYDEILPEKLGELITVS